MTGSDMDVNNEIQIQEPIHTDNITDVIETAFNGRFILEIAAIFKRDNMKISTCGSPTKAIIINDCVLLMPLMLN